VRFSGVSFGYDDGADLPSVDDETPDRDRNLIEESSRGDDGSDVDKEIVLHNITFDLAPGKVLGLLGRTGSGKTTLIRLLVRFYDPDAGTIALGTPPEEGVDLRRIPLDELRRYVGIVTQEIQLFNASVRDNLTFFDAAIPDETICEMIDMLGLGAWLDDLPNGLDTLLDADGGGLSAGEAQLLAFTRIFLQDPGLIVLDEASSRLDPATEHLIEGAIDRLLEGRTAIVIAHRLGTVERADEIMILEHGRVLEHGPRLSLAQEPDAHFHRLLQQGLEEVMA
jgi:ABC-type multidrug transport system fused ATPase/permease subunit